MYYYQKLLTTKLKKNIINTNNKGIYTTEKKENKWKWIKIGQKG